MPQKHEYLSKNQQIVLSIIEKAKGPLKAYSILYNVQKKGIKAPLQVYRALEKLIEIGKIHKIESKNAFIACKNCEHVKEIKNTKLSKYLSNFEDNSGMKYKKYNLEFFGLCRDCKLKQ